MNEDRKIKKYRKLTETEIFKISINRIAEDDNLKITKEEAARKAAEEEAEEPAAPAPEPKKAVKQEDPFADWDRANAKANAVKARRSEVVAAASKPAAKPAAPVQKQPAIQQPVRTNAQVAAAASKPAANAAPVKPAAPSAKPAAASAPRPAAKPVVEEEFSLDDILNEFK